MILRSIRNPGLRTTFTCSTCGRVGKTRFAWVRKTWTTPGRYVCSYTRRCSERYWRKQRASATVAP